VKRSTPLLRKPSPTAKLAVPVFRPKRCRVCGGFFTPSRSIQPACGLECSLIYADKVIAKSKAKQAAEERKATRAGLEKLKTRSQWLKETQVAFNAMVRKRDEVAGLACISCGRLDREAWDAGHFRSVGSAPELRFSGVNTWRQCVPCNQHQHGNLIEYRKGLLDRIGAAAVEALEGPHPPRHYSIEDLKAMKAEFKAKLKELKA
jgi:hypothetical protein